MKTPTLSGPLPAELGNQISDAIVAACARGMDLDEAVCVVIQVAADYGRQNYGKKYLHSMCQVIKERGTRPLPEGIPVTG